MICPTCFKDRFTTLQGTPWKWCETCGTMIGPISNHIPKSARISHGLVSVAAEAVHRVNRKLLGFPADDLGKAGVRETFEDITEALSAILHELEARDVETRPDVLTKAIADGVVGIERERERCAKLAEGARPPMGLCSSCPARSFPIELAAEIRRVPK